MPEAFGRFGEHARLELRFHDEMRRTSGKPPPRPDHVTRLLAFGRDLAAEPPPAAHLLVHCHAGVSRSTASMALVLAQALPGRSGPEIMDVILHIRPQAWPNLRMIEFGDPMLSRGGDLVAAAHRVYRRQLAAGRHSAVGMTAAGRGREVMAARKVEGALRAEPISAGRPSAGAEPCTA